MTPNRPVGTNQLRATETQRFQSSARHLFPPSDRPAASAAPPSAATPILAPPLVGTPVVRPGDDSGHAHGHVDTSSRPAPPGRPAGDRRLAQPSNIAWTAWTARRVAVVLAAVALVVAAVAAHHESGDQARRGPRSESAASAPTHCKVRPQPLHLFPSSRIGTLPLTQSSTCRSQAQLVRPTGKADVPSR